MSDLHIVQTTRDHAVGYLPGAVFYVWRRATTVAGAQLLAQIIREAAAWGQEQQTLLFGVVEATAPPPEAHVRKALGDSLRVGAGVIRASAIAFEGQGFRASMVRAVATGIAMLARYPFPHEAFPGTTVASQWLEQHRDSRGRVIRSASALDQTLQVLRRA